ncbi:MAG: replicative DNA helicase [Clostridia bacterium]|nr:replicative DNA helicase [Clostridia bacterium]
MALNYKSMPYNLEAEQSILGCIIIDQVMQMDAVSELTEDDFLMESHKKIFAAMREIISQNKPVDLVTLADLLQKDGELERVGGIAYLTELTQKIPSSANYGEYLDITKRDGILRRLITSANRIIEDATDSKDSVRSLQFAEKEIFDISEARERHSLDRVGEFFNEVIDKFERISKDKNALIGLKTGFTRLDYYTNGLQKGNLIILAARPSVGKTTFAMNIAENVGTKKDAVVAVFSLEMTKVELAQRMLCSVGSVKMDDALKGKLADVDPDGFKRLFEAQKLLSQTKIFIDDSTKVTPQDILSKCRRLKARQGGKLDLIIVDHIQLMESAKMGIESRQQEVTDISRNLKMIAKELDVPLLALSQLSRQVTGRKGGRPMLSDLRESGAIEQDADVVMFLHRPEAVSGPQEGSDGSKPSTTELIIAKNRNGICDRLELNFDGAYCKFTNVDYSNATPPAQKTQSDYRRDAAERRSNEQREDDFSSFQDEDVNSLNPPDEEEPF